MVFRWLFAAVCAKITLNDVTSAVRWTKNECISLIGFFSTKSEGQIFSDLEKDGIGKSMQFAQSVSEDLLERYNLTHADLPALVLLRNFDEDGKDIRSRREFRLAAKSRGTISDWSVAQLRKFAIQEAVPPYVLPDSGEEWQKRMELVQKSTLPRLFYYFSGQEEKKTFVNAFTAENNEPNEFFKKVVVIALEWTGDKKAKEKLKSFSGYKDKIKTPLLVKDGRKVGTAKKSDKLKSELRKALGLSAPKKITKESAQEESSLSLKDLVDEWGQCKFKKTEAAEREDFLTAKMEKTKEMDLHVKIVAHVGVHVDLLEMNEDDLRKEVETEGERKIIARKLLGME